MVDEDGAVVSVLLDCCVVFYVLFITSVFLVGLIVA
jgi:hypothetical protein